jgi:hypothetical protein
LPPFSEDRRFGDRLRDRGVVEGRASGARRTSRSGRLGAGYLPNGRGVLVGERPQSVLLRDTTGCNSVDFIVAEGDDMRRSRCDGRAWCETSAFSFDVVCLGTGSRTDESAHGLLVDATGCFLITFCVGGLS